MKQEEVDKLMLKIDKKCKLPKYWDNFINENSKTHHLIIKDKEKKKLYCTNCNKYFIDKTIKVRDYVECPNCHKYKCQYINEQKIKNKNVQKRKLCNLSRFIFYFFYFVFYSIGSTCNINNMRVMQ